MRAGERLDRPARAGHSVVPSSSLRVDTPLTDLAARAEGLAHSRRWRAALVLAVVLYGAHHASRGMGDFKVYRRAAKRAVAGETVYRLSDPHRYLYAPVVTFLFFPLALMPALAGRILWLTFNFFLLVSIFRLTAEMLFPRGRAPPGFHLLLLVLSFRFIDNNLGHGQINILLLWLILEAYALAAKHRRPLAGLALAAAIATKIIPAIFVVQILLRRQWRFAAWTAAGFVFLTVIPVVWWGAAYPRLLQQWAAVLVDQVGHYDMSNKINQSISAFAFRLFRPYPEGSPLFELPPAAVTGLTVAVHLLFVVPLVVLSLRASKTAQSDARRDGDELSLYLLYSTVAAPYSWKYYFVNLVFPFGSAGTRLWGRDHRRFEIGLGAVFALNLLAGLELLGKRLSTLFQFWSFHFLGVCILFALLAASALRHERGEDPQRPEASR